MRLALYVPSAGLSAYKRDMMDGMARKFAVVLRDVEEMGELPEDVVPCVASFMELKEIIPEWMRTGRDFIYWDRGYLSRGGKTWLRGNGTDHFRWHLNSYQMRGINPTASPKRLATLRVQPQPWRRAGRHIVIAAPSQHYTEFHGIEGWADRARLDAKNTGRPVLVRPKMSPRPLMHDLVGAHCLVTHGSVAAVEAVVMGCPVIVNPVSAAAPVGRTSMDDIENLTMPDRDAWMRSLASCQFTLREVARGEMWEMLNCQIQRSG